MPSKRNCVAAGIVAIALHAVSVLMFPWARYRIEMKVPVYSTPLTLEFQVRFVATCVTVMDADTVCVNFQSNELISQAVPSTNAATTTTRQLDSIASPPRRLASGTCSLPGGTTYYDGKHIWVTSTNCCQSCIDAPTCLYLYSRGPDCYLLGSYTSIKSRFLSYTKGYLSVTTTTAPPPNSNPSCPHPCTYLCQHSSPTVDAAHRPADNDNVLECQEPKELVLDRHNGRLDRNCCRRACSGLNERVHSCGRREVGQRYVGGCGGPNLVACAVGSVVCCAAALILVCVSVHFQVYLVAKVAVVLPNLTALTVLVFWLSTMAPMLTHHGFSATGPGMACLCIALVFYAICSFCAFSYVKQLELLEAAAMKLQQPGDVPPKITVSSPKLEEQPAAK